MTACCTILRGLGNRLILQVTPETENNTTYRTGAPYTCTQLQSMADGPILQDKELMEKEWSAAFFLWHSIIFVLLPHGSAIAQRAPTLGWNLPN